MKHLQRSTWLLPSVLILAALVVAALAWPEFQHATILVQWTTASEVDTAGFNVYRSEQRNGNFVRVNPELIPASPDPLTGGTYEFKDQDVTPGRTYYYVLEDVENSGTTNRSPEVVEVKAERGGQELMLASAALALIGLFGLMRGFTRQRDAAEPAEATES